MGQGVGVDIVTAELAEDSPARLAGASVNQDVPEQVCVDGVRQYHRVQVPDTIGELLHAAERIRAGWGCRDRIGMQSTVAKEVPMKPGATIGKRRSRRLASRRPSEVQVERASADAASAGAASLGAGAIGAFAVGAIAAGAGAIGALAIGRLAIGRLALGRAAVKRLQIEELEVGRLQVRELEVAERTDVAGVPGAS